MYSSRDDSALRSKNGGEYISKDFEYYLKITTDWVISIGQKQLQLLLTSGIECLLKPLTSK